MAKYSIEDIQATLAEYQVENPDEFIKSLKQKDKDRKKAEDEKPIHVEVYSDAIITELEHGWTPEEAIRESVSSAKNSDVYHDIFYDPKGLDDSGADATVYFKGMDKFYKVELHCKAEWVGDWSVRKNIPGDVSVTKITELTNYTIKAEEETYIYLDIPNK
jgi:hypothetical protein